MAVRATESSGSVRFVVFTLWPQEAALSGAHGRPDVIAAETVALVRGLRDAGYRIAVVTSSGRIEVEPILHSFWPSGSHRYSCLWRRCEESQTRSDPYLLACERLATRNALVVEDSPAGVASAQAAGLEVIQLKSQSELIWRVDRGLSSLA